MSSYDRLKNKILETVDALADEAWGISQFLFDNPELGLQELKASATLTSTLEKYGFTVERGVGNLPTAFKAYRTGTADAPSIAFLSEYDALPTIGHGCGHNLIAIVGSFAGIAVAHVINELPGRVLVIGTPAEETIGGKIRMLENGVFDDVDIAMMAHPSTETVVRAKALAAQTTVITFHGKPAHAAATPWRGINALDALIQTFVGLDQLRKQLKPSVRIAGIITEGGERPNVIPEKAVGKFSIRAENYDELKELLNKVQHVAEGAALATGAKVEIIFPEPPYLDMRNVESLASTFEKKWLELGGTLITDPGKTPGSLDIGNVSHKIPALHPSFAITDKHIAGHTREFADATRTPMARRETIRMIKALAITALEIFINPDLFNQIKREFAQLQ
ncbi:M20 family metallopeptidase [Candidatus Sumerlaeota bacterium]|nr:M20 family metallopeptidase [Candidatus Sumerlaeota bacterium]